jgi:hypothetical protein
MSFFKGLLNGCALSLVLWIVLGTLAYWIVRL